MKVLGFRHSRNNIFKEKV
jgi:hypothetical protein